MSKPHSDHVRAHLERVRYGHLVTPSPEGVYLGLDEGDAFWELVGLRLTGCPAVVLAALRFQHLGLPGISHARESLATYLSALPTPRATDEAGVLTALLPHHQQEIGQFLRGLRAGGGGTPVSIDPARIEVAFDFRLENPAAVEDFRLSAGPLRDHYYRTVDGHVLRGRSHSLPVGRADEDRFVAIRSPEQLTAHGVYPLPTLFMSRKYLALRVDTTEEEANMAVRNWVPFLPATASSEDLLLTPEPSRRLRAATSV